MNPIFGWTLALAALVAGFALNGWKGLMLAVTIIAFWLLLQFSQVMRVMRGAAQSPVGHVASAVMLNAKLHAGMRVIDVVRLTQSLGRKLDQTSPEVLAWQDKDGDRVEASFNGGRLVSWQLHRVPQQAS
jgi:hypothetical protein